MPKSQLDLQTVKKHHFWICVGGTVLIALPCWFLARSHLSDQFETERRKRESVRESVSRFAASEQPNPDITGALDTRRNALNKQVFAAWVARYTFQEPLMRPKLQIWGDEKEQLPEAVLQEFQKYRRGESDDIPVNMRRFYAGWVKDKFPKLYSEIGLRTPIQIAPKEDDGEDEDGQQFNFRDGGGDGRKMAEWGGFVAWTQSERLYLEQKFGKAAFWDLKPPTSEEIVYTQQSLNVYYVLLSHIIHKTNGDVPEHQLLHIKKLVTVRIGEDCGRPPAISAVAALGVPAGLEVDDPAANPGGVDDGGGGGFSERGRTGNLPFSVGPLAGAGGGIEQDGEEAFNRVPRVGNAGGPRPPNGRMRYVNDEGLAIVDPKNQPYSEFVMLPVRLRVIMDHRKLPTLLANCVNSPLPIEVEGWNMRTLPKDAVRQARDVDDEFGFGDRENNQGVKKQRIRFGGEIEPGPYDREIEIDGFIRIYNRPDPAKVGKGMLAQGPAAADPGEPPPEDPAGQPMPPMPMPPMPMPPMPMPMPMPTKGAMP